MLERLGATPELYIPLRAQPQVVVYVEGRTDRPIIESLIRSCRRRRADLPSTLVIPHREGRFDAVALQAIVRYMSVMKHQSQVVGLRDLDWHYEDYSELPPEKTDLRGGKGYTLLTLPVKELENLFCDAEILRQVFEEKIPSDELTRILNELSNEKELVEDWRFQSMPRIRGRMAKKLDPATSEREAEATFESWRSDPLTRARLVAGKELLRHVQAQILQEYKLRCHNNQMLDHVRSLTPPWADMAATIFPGHDWSSA
jgi:hypothetical protein